MVLFVRDVNVDDVRQQRSQLECGEEERRQEQQREESRRRRDSGRRRKEDIERFGVDGFYADGRTLFQVGGESSFPGAGRQTIFRFLFSSRADNRPNEGLVEGRCGGNALTDGNLYRGDDDDDGEDDDDDGENRLRHRRQGVPVDYI